MRSTNHSKLILTHLKIEGTILLSDIAAEKLIHCTEYKMEILN